MGGRPRQRSLPAGPSRRPVVHFQKKRHAPEALSSNIVRSIAEDGLGQIWLGTEGGGLNLFLPHPGSPDSSTFRHWRPYNSILPDDNILNLSVDGRERLWLSTDAGLFSFDPKIQKFRAHPLPGSNKGLNAKIRQGTTNLLFAANAQHLYRFRPDSLYKNSPTPPVFITGLEIGGRPISVRGTVGDSLEEPSPLGRSILFTESLDLKYWQNDLTFAFTALNYLEPENDRYRYRMENYDADWIETDASNRRIRYTNLSPGKYQFQVLAANNEGLWNGAGRTIAVRIRPPWWLTWWAYGFYFLSALALLYAVGNYEVNRKLARAEARRLKELDKIKTGLYTNITHEFRTPLTIIMGMADQLADQVSEHGKEGMRMIKRNGRLLLNLVNQMLDLAKLEAQKVNLDYEQGDIVNYLQYLTDSFHSLAESKGIRLHFLCREEEFLMDYDANRLSHIVSNLLSNAIKFSPKGKDVYIIAEVVDEELQIAVRDTGIGIPREKLPFIFNSFYQVDDSTVRKSGGTGIGLTLTKELVRLMKGRITVYSELGKGSEFKVSLPVTRLSPVKPKPERNLMPAPVDAPDPVVSAPQAAQNKPLVLIVEDNPSLVKYLTVSLNPTYNLEIAYNGLQGLEKATSSVPDIILTDIMMPEKDGFELCADLKRHTLTSHIPVIMLTAKADADSRMTGIRRGADAYLEKPFLQEELEVRIRALLEQRKRLQAYYRKMIGIPSEGKIKVPDREEATTENAFLDQINRIIHSELSNRELDVELLCKELFLSSSSLYRKIKALTGMGPNQ